MSRTKQTPAAETFTAMGIDEADYTKAMRNAVRQRWGNIPTDKSVGDLRAAIAAVEPEATPSEDALVMSLIDTIPDGIARAAAAEKEAKRLAANAKVNAWRERGRLQAALDARSIKFARLRAAKGKPVAVDVTDAATDPAPEVRQVEDLPAL